MGKYTNKLELLTLATEIIQHVEHGAPMLLPPMPKGFAILQDSGAESHWRREWRKFERFMLTGAPQWGIFKNGNSKLPFVAFSALPAICLLYTSQSPRDRQKSRMPSSA